MFYVLSHVPHVLPLRKADKKKGLLTINFYRQDLVASSPEAGLPTPSFYMR